MSVGGPSIEANLAAITLARSGRPLDDGERQVVAGWRGWGALPEAFLVSNPANAALRALLSPAEYEAAQHSTLNAHYTDPAIVAAMWRLAVKLGAADMTMVEPGCGSGNFIAGAPDQTKVTGVELDPVTADIAAALHPAARVVCENFIGTDALGACSFGLSLGNVPFGDYAPFDGVWNPHGMSIHNAFISKVIELLAEGGLGALITSRHTVESNGDGHLERFAEQADCLGIVRLPGRAHRYAGTDVVTDIAIFAKRTPRAHERPNRIMSSADVRVIGTERGDRANGRIGAYEVLFDGDLGAALDEAFDAIVAATEFRCSAQVRERAPEEMAPVAVDPNEGVFSLDGDALCRVVAGRRAAWTAKPKKDHGELVHLVRLRDAIRRVLDAQDDAPAALASVQADALAIYQSYVASYGYIWRHETRTIAGDDGDDEVEFVRPSMGGFRSDPTWHIVGAVEEWDETAKVGRPAAIFFRRVAGRGRAEVKVASIADAVLVVLDRVGAIDVDEVARLANVPAAVVAAELPVQGLAYRDPVSGLWQPAVTYLAGNVRAKLVDAERAGAGFEANVAALSTACPPLVAAGMIDSEVGAPWISAADLAAFCKHLGATLSELTVDQWTGSIVAKTYGSPRRQFWTQFAPFEKLFGDLLNQRQTTAKVEVDGKDRPSRQRTAEANDAKERIRAEFRSWLRSDPVRSAAIADVYNTKFNCYAAPKWSSEGLSLPGLSEAFMPWQHQLEAVSWLRHNHGGLLGHAIGAGKTGTMIISAMELRRLGIAQRPCIVVPNHMLEQVAAEFYRLYPAGKALIASKDDLAAKNRRMFMSRAAAGDWDLVIMTHSSFGRIPSSPATMARYEALVYQQRAGNTELGVNATRGQVKQLEKRKAKARDAARKAIAQLASDPFALTFDATGIDFLFVDESQQFKKLPNASASGYSSVGSARARDLHAKIIGLRHRFGRGRAAFATGTWITNTLAEAWVVQTFLQPDRLEEAGLAPFDRWLGAFGRMTSRVELDPSGSGYRMASRLDRFENVSELMRMVGADAHFVSPDRLEASVPAAEHTTVVIPADPVLTAYTKDLALRAKAVRGRDVDPTVDNMLKISGDGRKAALDLRLIGLAATDPTRSKVAVAAGRILGRWRDATEHQVLQLVFCDIGVHGSVSVYETLKAELVAGGMPAERIRFAIEASTDAERAELFGRCRDGAVSVLVASTAKAGLGTNVQNLLFAVCDLDAPWRPDELTQRHGRGLRAGNLNDTVVIENYVVEGSFDAFVWATLERKERMIAPVRYGSTAIRSVEIDDSVALSYAEIAAAAAGNPLMIEKAQIDARIAQLLESRSAHEASIAADRAMFSEGSTKIDDAHNRVALLETQLEVIKSIAHRIYEDNQNGVVVEGWERRAWASSIYHDALGITVEVSYEAVNRPKALVAAMEAMLGSARADVRRFGRWIDQAGRLADELGEWDGVAELASLQARQAELVEVLGDLIVEDSPNAVTIDEIEIRVAAAREGDAAMLNDPEPVVRRTFAGAVKHPTSQDVAVLVADTDVEVRRIIARRMPSVVSAETLRVVLADPSVEVRQAFASSFRPVSSAHVEVFDDLLSDPDEQVRVDTLSKCSLGDARVTAAVLAGHRGVTEMLASRARQVPDEMVDAIVRGGHLAAYVKGLDRQAFGGKPIRIPADAVTESLSLFSTSSDALTSGQWVMLAVSTEASTDQALACLTHAVAGGDSLSAVASIVSKLADRSDPRVVELIEMVWDKGLPADGDMPKHAARALCDMVSGAAFGSRAAAQLLARAAFEASKPPQRTYSFSGYGEVTFWSLFCAAFSANLFTESDWPEVAWHSKHLTTEQLLRSPITGSSALHRIGSSSTRPAERVAVAKHRNAPVALIEEWASKSSSAELVRAAIGNPAMTTVTLERLASHRDPLRSMPAVKALTARASELVAVG